MQRFRLHVMGAIREYWSDRFNRYDAIAMACSLLALLRMQPGDGPQPIDVNVLRACGVCFLWLRLQRVLLVFSRFGPYTFMVFVMIDDVINYLVILLLYPIAFAALVSVLLEPPSAKSHPFNLEVLPVSEFLHPDCSSFQSFPNAFIYLVEHALTGEGFFECAHGGLGAQPWPYPAIIWAVSFAYTFFAGLLLLNMLIAMMAKSFDSVGDQKTAYYVFRYSQLVYSAANAPPGPPPFYILSVPHDFVYEPLAALIGNKDGQQQSGYKLQCVQRMVRWKEISAHIPGKDCEFFISTFGMKEVPYSTKLARELVRKIEFAEVEFSEADYNNLFTGRYWVGQLAGSKWKEVGLFKPTFGHEISDAPRLSAALAQKQEFTEDEVKEFELEGLSVDSFIRAQNKYFMQAGLELPAKETARDANKNKLSGVLKEKLKQNLQGRGRRSTVNLELEGNGDELDWLSGPVDGVVEVELDKVLVSGDASTSTWYFMPRDALAVQHLTKHSYVRFRESLTGDRIFQFVPAKGKVAEAKAKLQSCLASVEQRGPLEQSEDYRRHANELKERRMRVKEESTVEDKDKEAELSTFVQQYILHNESEGAQNERWHDTIKRDVNSSLDLAKGLRRSMLTLAESMQIDIDLRESTASRGNTEPSPVLQRISQGLDSDLLREVNTNLCRFQTKTEQALERLERTHARNEHNFSTKIAALEHMVKFQVPDLRHLEQKLAQLDLRMSGERSWRDVLASGAQTRQ